MSVIPVSGRLKQGDVVEFQTSVGNLKETLCQSLKNKNKANGESAQC